MSAVVLLVLGVTTIARADEALNARADALLRQARATGHTKLLAEAARAAAQSIEVAPGNPEGRKLRIRVLLAQRDYRGALEQAELFQKSLPDDVPGYGLLAEALISVGKYEEAERNVQWMLDLRRTHPDALIRTGQVREMRGDIEGAIQVFDDAYRALHPAEVEERAWLLTGMARLVRLFGKPEDAGRLVEQSLGLMKGYHPALLELASIRLAQRRPDEAVALLRKAHEQAPHPRILYRLAVAAAQTSEEASSEWAAFEAAARSRLDEPDHANRELILYLIDIRKKPEEALRLARREATQGMNVWDLDALAWALRATGDHTSARRIMEQVRSLGIKDPVILAHQAAILK